MKSLIEDWFPIETVGCESMRDASAAQKPPLNSLHWWPRRPLTASRAAMVALMPQGCAVSRPSEHCRWPLAKGFLRRSLSN